MVIEIEYGELILHGRDDLVTLGDFQDYVGGRIMTIPVPRVFPDKAVVGYVNDDPAGLHMNCYIPGVGAVRGPLLISGIDENGAYRDLDPAEYYAYQLVEEPPRGLPTLRVVRPTPADAPSE